MIGLKESCQFFNQWEAKPKPIAPCKRDFFRASSELQVIARNCDWFIALFVPVVIGRSNCFGFGFWKPLYPVHNAIGFVVFIRLIALSILWTTGARFSKVPSLFERISGNIVLFVSSKPRRLEARNFTPISIVIPFTTYEMTRFTEWAGRSFTNGFSGPKSLRHFRETRPSCCTSRVIF